MDKFSSLEGRTYELGGLAGAMGALRIIKASKECKQQIARIISRLGEFNLTKIISQFSEEIGTDIEDIDPKLVKSVSSILGARLFQGYVQGFCETQQFIKSLPCRTLPQLVWVYANPSLVQKKDYALGQEIDDILALAQQELSMIADFSDFDFGTLKEKGKLVYQH